MNSNKQIVKNASQGYGYSYSNLADLAKAGVEIPVMKTQRVDGDEYVFALIDGEWIQGAKVIEMEMKGMNAAQAYGSALTYARRYTVQLVKGIACDDDDKVEADGAAKRVDNKNSKLDFDKIREQLDMLDDIESVKAYYEELKKIHQSPAQEKYINGMFNKKKAQIAKD
ncbi:MAG: ERF family protein [Bacteroidales bacterium]|nr:ERF family protein [Bacteroidales bacterium]